MFKMETTVAYNYSFVLSFEENFDLNASVLWFGHYWTHALYCMTVFLLLVFGGQQWMSKREPFSLRKPLIFWNMGLAIFALFGTIRTFPQLYHSLANYGFYQSVCNNIFIRAPVPSFWAFLFIISKVFELGDIVFLVLEKKPLYVLHWYHHTTVVLFTWYAYADRASAGLWYINMNYLVHFILYSYFTLITMRIIVPKLVAIIITSLVIVQVVLGAMVTLYALFVKIGGQPCHMSDPTVYSGVVMYLSYFVLLANIFANLRKGSGSANPTHSDSKPKAT